MIFPVSIEELLDGILSYGPTGRESNIPRSLLRELLNGVSKGASIPFGRGRG